MAIQPYLMFNGRCAEAIEFYRRALGAEVAMLMRFGESPEPHAPGSLPLGWDDKIMHCELRIGRAVLFASDGNSDTASKFDSFSLALTVDDEGEAQRHFVALSEGGCVHVPLTRTFFTPQFGMLADRFGVPWMIYVQTKG